MLSIRENKETETETKKLNRKNKNLMKQQR